MSIRPSATIFDNPRRSIDSWLKLVQPRDFIARFCSNGTFIHPFEHDSTLSFYFSFKVGFGLVFYINLTKTAA